MANKYLRPIIDRLPTQGDIQYPTSFDDDLDRGAELRAAQYEIAAGALFGIPVSSDAITRVRNATGRNPDGRYRQAANFGALSAFDLLGAGYKPRRRTR